MGIKELSHAAERKAFSTAIDGFLKHIKKKDYADRSETYCKLVDTAATFWGKGANKEKMEAAKKALSNPDNRWVKFLNRVIDETDPHYAKTMLLNLGYEAFFRGTKMIRANRESMDVTFHGSFSSIQPWPATCTA